MQKLKWRSEAAFDVINLMLSVFSVTPWIFKFTDVTL